MKKTITVIIIVAVLALVGWRLYLALFEGGNNGNRRGPMAVAVEISPVEQKTVRDIGEFSGTLLPRSQFSIAPKVSGRLEKLYVNIGDTVHKGDLIAVLDSEEYEQQVIQARAELEVTQATLAESRNSLDIATREYERAKDLLSQRIASATELDSALANLNAAKSKLEVTEAQIKQKDAALKAAEVRLSYTRIVATWDDNNPRRVAERFFDEGAMLRANDAIVSLVDLSTVRAIINVVEEDFPKIIIGQLTTISTDAYSDKEFNGKVARSAPVLQEESRQARVEIEIPNPEGLLAPGMFVRVMIEFSEHTNATVVPQAAVVRYREEAGVFSVDVAQKKAVFVPCQIGVTDGNWIEILSPSLEGQVVTIGQHLLEDGAPVTFPEEGGAGTNAPDTAQESN